MLRRMSLLLLFVLIANLMTQPALANTTPMLARLAEIEVAMYGASQESGPILPRVSRLETDLYGRPGSASEPIITRVEKLASIVAQGGTSILMKLNAAEWMIFQTQSSNKPLFERLADIEKQVYGSAVSDRSITDRVNDLVSLVWSSGTLTAVPVQVHPGLAVRVRLMTELNSSSSRPGDQVRYQVVNDVTIDNKLIIPVGAEATGVVKEVQKAGAFGRPGQVVLDVATVRAIDGTPIKLTFQRATGEKGAQELAAGASLGGMVLLGPLGLAAGALVQGKADSVPAGAEFSLEVKDPVNVQGLSLVPVK